MSGTSSQEGGSVFPEAVADPNSAGRGLLGMNKTLGSPAAQASFLQEGVALASCSGPWVWPSHLQDCRGPPSPPPRPVAGALPPSGARAHVEVVGMVDSCVKGISQAQGVSLEQEGRIVSTLYPSHRSSPRTPSRVSSPSNLGPSSPLLLPAPLSPVNSSLLHGGSFS